MERESRHRVVEVELPDGSTALFEALMVGGGGAHEVGLEDRFGFEHVQATLRGVTGAVTDALAAHRPDELTVEVGLEVAVRAGKLTCLIVGGEGSATMRVAMTWKREASQ